MALTKFNFNSFDVTSAASKGLGFNASANGFSTIDPGSMTLIKTLTASSSANLSFVHGSSDVVFDNTYPVYMFKFINIHPASTAYFQFNLSADSGSNYNVTKTTTLFQAYQNEAGNDTSLGYNTGQDLTQSTSPQYLTEMTTSDDDSGSGSLIIFNPSSTTFVKHFIADNNGVYSSYSNRRFVSGYANTTSAIDAIQFTMSSGNIDSGTIKLYGIKDS